MSQDSTKPPARIPEEESFITYPLRFPIKVMGLADAAFTAAMLATVQQHDASFTAEHIAARHSSSGKYLSLTLSPWIENRAQLDNLYRALTSHPLVRYAI